MSNDLLSQQLSMESIQMGQLRQVPSKLESTDRGLMTPGVNQPAILQIPMQNLQMGPMGADSSDMMSQQVPVSNYQALKLEPVADNRTSQNLLVSNAQMGQMGPQVHHKVQEQLASFRSHSREMESISNLQQASTLTKRKAPMESLSTNSASQKLLAPNKRVAQAEHRPWLQQISPSGRSASQAQSFSNPAGSPRPQAFSKRSQSTIGAQQTQAASKRSVPSKTGTQQVTVQRNQARQMVASSKVQNESFDSVRSKMRESLASALALVPQSKDNTSAACAGKSSKSKQSEEKSKSPAQISIAVNEHECAPGEPKGDLPAKEGNLTQKMGDGQSASRVVSNSADDSTGALNGGGKELQSIITLSDDDVSFSDSLFVKDELLQGNGLSWVLESDVDLAAKNDVVVQATQEQPCQEDGQGHGGQPAETPENLAAKIETELFKLFGGVNKKYKEKGRSLLFNLKDRNNPELVERVMSGEIPPERLCSMTAEELASKELSEWRIAKAEELAQMVVLPDTQVDIRRLVKKTHKGEFQVEIEEPDAISAEVAVGTSLPIKERGNDADENPKPEGQEDSEPSNVDANNNKSNAANGKINLVNQDIPYTLTIPSNEGTDLLQGLMVDDELKDTQFLPPIVSLDEFMESLNSEPPFEDLPGDAEGRTPISDGDNEEVERESKSLDTPMDAQLDTTSVKSDDAGMIEVKPEADEKPIYSPVKSVATPIGEVKGEYVWDGLLQLNISATAPVIATFKSGEKTSTKDWPSQIEVKGRVRLDAFGKFLQELPKSRSRAVMAVHFFCKDESAEKDVHEVADSYLLDGRVGLAEPAPGVELYVCPPHGKTREMLGNVLPKDQVDTLDPLDNGLIGVVVWRKVTSTLSPKSASHHKHNSKKQHVTSRRHHEKDTKANVSITTKHPGSPRGVPTVNPIPQFPPEGDDDDDDIPPGFGPPPSRAEDDLPEFSFSRSSTMPRPQYCGQNSIPGIRTPHFDPQSQSVPRPVDQIRQLIHRYGQPQNTNPLHNLQERRGLGVAVQPWNDDDDDDDDMPEWRPEDTQRQYQSLQQPRVQQQLLRPHMVHPAQAIPLQPPTTLMQKGSWTPASSHVFPVPQPDAAQFYGPPPGYGVAQQGAHWRRNAPESRGF